MSVRILLGFLCVCLILPLLAFGQEPLPTEWTPEFYQAQEKKEDEDERGYYQKLLSDPDPQARLGAVMWFKNIPDLALIPVWEIKKLLNEI